NLPWQQSHHNVGPAIVIVILKNYAHAGHSPSIFGKRRAGFEPNLGESAVAIVVIQVLLHAIVRYKDVSETVAIVVRESYSQRASLLGRNAGALAHIGKSSIAVVVIKDVSRGRELFWRTISMVVTAAILIMFRIPLHVASHEKVQLPVVVVVEKSRRLRPAASGNSGFLRHIGEGADTV